MSGAASCRSRLLPVAGGVAASAATGFALHRVLPRLHRAAKILVAAGAGLGCCLLLPPLKGRVRVEQRVTERLSPPAHGYVWYEPMLERRLRAMLRPLDVRVRSEAAFVAHASRLQRENLTRSFAFYDPTIPPTIQDPAARGRHLAGIAIDHKIYLAAPAKSRLYLTNDAKIDWWQVHHLSLTATRIQVGKAQISLTPEDFEEILNKALGKLTTNPSPAQLIAGATPKNPLTLRMPVGFGTPQLTCRWTLDLPQNLPVTTYTAYPAHRTLVEYRAFWKSGGAYAEAYIDACDERALALLVK